MKKANSLDKKVMIGLCMGSLLLFYLIFMIAPIMLSFVMSFFEWNPFVGQKEFIGLRNYTDAFKEPLFWSSMLNTVIFAAVCVFVTAFAGLILAVLIFNVKRFKTFFRTAYFLPVVTSMVAVSILWKYIFNPQIGVLNYLLGTIGLPEFSWLNDSSTALLCIILVTIWKDIGYPIIIFMAGLSGIPGYIYESARLDGAGWWQTLLHITLPCIKPTMMFVLITNIINYLQSFTQVYLMTKGGPGTHTYTISLMIYNKAFAEYHFGYAAALSFILFVVIIALSAFQMKAMKMDWGY